MKIYKIRNEEGLFSTGRTVYGNGRMMGMEFNKIGNAWTLDSLTRHLDSRHSDFIFWYSVGEVYKNCKVIEFDLVETENEVNPGQLFLEKALFEEI